MNNYVETVKQKRIEKTIKKLKQNLMDARYVASIDELVCLLDELVADKSTVCYGGSVTLNETGVLDYLRNRDINLLDRDDPNNTPEDKEQIMHDAFSSDIFFASANAITEDGALFNVDGRGNRTAAMLYGPKSVIVIAGYNKIVSNIDEAVQRIRKKAAPANTLRLSSRTPCTKTGECMDCHSPDRICCDYVAISHQYIKDRIKVIILNEDYGF